MLQKLSFPFKRKQKNNNDNKITNLNPLQLNRSTATLARNKVCIRTFAKNSEAAQEMSPKRNNKEKVQVVVFHIPKNKK